MKAVILAGGFGTRITEESRTKPKPMVEIGGKPIIWHIMKLYSFYGISEFIICCGYKGYVIKEYFANYFLHRSDVTFDIKNNSMKVHLEHAEPWKVTLVDTGQNTMTGGRLKRVSSYIDQEDSFCFTYGDGLSDINITELVNFHKSHNKKATLTSVNPTGRFVIGGPDGDTGLTGRKIIVDTYGGAAPHGGGAFSGKDPTKVDRSAAYAARYIAKNVVGSKIAEKCLIQLAYAIGVSKPLSIYVDLFDNDLDKNKFVVEKIKENFDLSPRGIREMLNLNKPIYEKTAAYGHFGRAPEENGSFSWEKTDKTNVFSK